MATSLTFDLSSELLDLGTIPLDELRDMHTPALVAAINRVYANTAKSVDNGIQDQRG